MRDRIRRAPRDQHNPYFMMHQKTAQDEGLSFEARGLLAYLLSKPDDWKLNVSDLMRAGHCGRDKVRKILRELEERHYLEREQVKGEGGHFSHTEYWVYERPLTENPSTVESPSTGKPSTGKPSTENPHLQSIEEEQNTERTEAQPPKSSPKPSKKTMPSAGELLKAKIAEHPIYQAYIEAHMQVFVSTPTLTQKRAKEADRVIATLDAEAITPEMVLRRTKLRLEENSRYDFAWLEEDIDELREPPPATPEYFVAPPVVDEWTPEERAAAFQDIKRVKAELAALQEAQAS